jgi:vacuolar iron transporter family protein
LNDDTKRYLDHLEDERNGGVLYRALAGAEANPKLAEIYRRMAVVEDRHALVWEEKLKAAGVPVPAFRRPSLRTRTLAWLARRFGVGAVLPTVMTLEQADSQSYGSRDQARMAADEKSHARLISHISQSGTGGLEGAALARIEGRHRSAGGNALRAAVLGANDGLVSNLSLVMGVAGAEMSGSAILVTGLAGLLAGAGSMALGEWLSVQSSRELYQRQIKTEKEELEAAPEEEAEELALIYQAKGIPEEMAHRMADEIVGNPQAALDTLAREELGIDPGTLGGSAWEAAIASFLLFVSGAIVPVLPFMFARGGTAVMASIAASTAALFLIGAAITVVTGVSLWRSGLRQVVFGLAAAAVTYGVGFGLGAAITG